MTVGRKGNIVIRSASESHTEQIGNALGRRIHEGRWICLTGSLGSGKSVLARGICKGLGVTESVISPTFILFEEYRGRLPVVHCDLYRLQHESDLEELGLFEVPGRDCVVLVEWGDRSNRVVDMADIILDLAVTGATERTITVNCRASDRSLFENI